MDTLPTVAMDEAGNTGENLLDPDQPVFALAALAVPVSDVEAAVRSALGRTQMKELKFNRLRTSNPGRRNILKLLEDLQLSPASAAVALAHKPYMVALKMVDELVEPRMRARGLRMAWYAGGAARNMAFDFAERAPRELGSVYQELEAAFVALVRDYSEPTAQLLQRALGRAKLVARDPLMRDILSVMISGAEELRSEFEHREDALDPALPLLFWQGVRWSNSLGQPFAVLHDESKTVARWAHLFEFAVRDAEIEEGEAAEPLVLGEITLDVPSHLTGITFGQSDRDARLQAADIVAGSAAHLYAVATGARRLDDFARDLGRAGMGELLQWWIGPAPRGS
jgi:hypothetical protein